MDALQAILTRRSTRKMKSQVPPRDLIEKVIQAGRHAPSGHNNQSTHLIVITDPNILSDLADMVREAFVAMEVTEGMYVSMKNAIANAKRGGHPFHYNAPVLIVAANRIGYGNAMADSACALENMMVAANALDLGTCWINQLHWLDGNPAIHEYMLKIGLGQDETITGSMILGYPAEGLPERTPLERKGNPVTWI